MSEPSPKNRYTANIQGEIDSAALYRALAEVEANPQLAGIYNKLAGVEDEHAAFWVKQMAKIGQPAPALKPSLRSRILAWMARRFGPGAVLPVVNAQERTDSGHYDNQSEAVAGGLPAVERSHATLLALQKTMEQYWI